MRSIMYLDGRDLERSYEAFMKFRLIYEGDLLSSKPFDANARSAHKHAIRKAFHPQLKDLWGGNRFLPETRVDVAYRGVFPEKATDYFNANPGRTLLTDALGFVFGHDGYKFVPFAWKEACVDCSLRILILRRDTPQQTINSRDIDNRVKTIIDALCMVLPKQGAPKDDAGNPIPVGNEEDPFFVLMDDDQRVAHLEVEYGDLLTPDPKNPNNLAYAKVIVTVETRATAPISFSTLSFRWLKPLQRLIGPGDSGWTDAMQQGYDNAMRGDS